MFVSHMDQIATNMESINNNTAIILTFVYQFSRINTPQLHNHEDCFFTLIYSFSHNGLTLNRGKKRCYCHWHLPNRPKSLSNVCIINVSNTSVRLSRNVRLYCFTLDRHATLYRHILQEYRSTYFQIRALGHIRNVSSNTSKSTAQVIQSLRQRYNPT